MYTISIEKAFQASHSLTLAGHAEPMHQHEWLVKATVSAAKLNQEGVVMDFILLQGILEKIAKPLIDVQNLNQIQQFQVNPSAEELAAYFYRQLKKELSQDVKLVKVTVQEAPGCKAAYFE